METQLCWADAVSLCRSDVILCSASVPPLPTCFHPFSAATEHFEQSIQVQSQHFRPALYFYERLWPLISICTPQHSTIDYCSILAPYLKIASVLTTHLELCGDVTCWHVSQKPVWFSSNLICCWHAGGWIDNGTLLIDSPALALSVLT